MPKTEFEFSNIQCSDNVVRGRVCVCGGAMELFVLIFHNQRFELGPSISYKIACVLSIVSFDVIMCIRCTLIRVFAGHSVDSQGAKASSYGQQRLIRVFDRSTCILVENAEPWLILQR